MSDSVLASRNRKSHDHVFGVYTAGPTNGFIIFVETITFSHQVVDNLC